MSAFFEPDRLYQHPTEGVFFVTYVGTAPEPFEHHAETLGVAFGWRRGLSPNGIVEGLGSYLTPDFHGWEPLRSRNETPDGCLWCGDARGHHGRQYHPAIGVHGWEPPTDAQRKARMLERRTELLHTVQATARRLRKEVDGRREHGKRLEEENARLRARVAELEQQTTTARTEAIADVGDWLDEIGQKDAAHLVYTCDIPAARDMKTVPQQDDATEGGEQR